MARRHGRCRRGERLRAGVPHGHWKTTTFVAGLRNTGMVAPMVLDGPINRDAFTAYVRQVLVPALRPGDIVVTSGTGGIYAPNVAVAYVVKLADDGAIARPLADPATAQFAIVEPIFEPTAADLVSEGAPAP